MPGGMDEIKRGDGRIYTVLFQRTPGLQEISTLAKEFPELRAHLSKR